MRSLRILVAHNVARSRTGGMSRIMGFIHDELAKDGHQVDYFCSGEVPPWSRGGLARVTFPALLRRHVRRALRIGRPYDIVNVHEPSAALVTFRKRALGDPSVVVTSHGVERRGWELALEELRLGRSGPSLKTRMIFPPTVLWQAALGLRRADHIFCLNQEDRSYLCNRLGRPEQMVTRIYPAADPIYRECADERDYQGADRLLFAATWRKNKGIEDLVPAFITLARRHPTLSLTVLGGGVDDGTVLNAFPPDVRPRVVMRRGGDERTTATAFAHSDIFILPSLFEGTPLTLMEAMMSGLPIVTTSTCGMKDLIRNDENGMLVPIRSPDALVDAIQALRASRDLRERHGRTARAEAASRYTWRCVAAPVREVYERLAAEVRKERRWSGSRVS